MNGTNQLRHLEAKGDRPKLLAAIAASTLLDFEKANLIEILPLLTGEAFRITFSAGSGNDGEYTTSHSLKRIF
jgi:hypothetical protein